MFIVELCTSNLLEDNNMKIREKLQWHRCSEPFWAFIRVGEKAERKRPAADKIVVTKRQLLLPRVRTLNSS